MNDEVRSFGLFPSHLPVVGFKEFRQDTEEGRNSSDDEGEHNVENFMLCSFAYHACSALLHEEELRWL